MRPNLPAKQLLAGLQKYYLSSSTTNQPVRTRFAPSPTGELHMGSLRTALFNYLWARKHGGSFVLRIEDTDRDRVVAGVERKYEHALDWLGIGPDESPFRGGPFGPYRQSDNLKCYQEAAERLIDSGRAYRCFCTAERIEILHRKAKMERTSYRYDGNCRNLTKEEAVARQRNGKRSTIRFKFEPGHRCSFKDIVYGHCDVTIEEMDFVIIKSDGYPVYHFAHVVDDHRMEITNVIRGMEWLISTPKHLSIYKAFEWEPPTYAHLPLLLRDDTKKLSKRDADGFSCYYIEKGYLPLAVLNFLAWNGSGIRDHDREILYSLDELVERFDEQLITQKNIKLSLQMLDNYGIKAYQRADIKTDILPVVRRLLQELPEEERHSVDNSLLNDEYLTRVSEFLKVCGDRIGAKKFSHLSELTNDDFRFFFFKPRNARKMLADGKVRILSVQQIVDLLNGLIQMIDDEPEEFTYERVKHFSETEKGIDHVLTCRIFRLAIVDNQSGPPLSELKQFFGAEELLARLRNMRQMVMDEEDGKGGVKKQVEAAQS